MFLREFSGETCPESQLAVCGALCRRDTWWDGCARGRWDVRVGGGGLCWSLMMAFLPVLKRDGLSPALPGVGCGSRGGRAPRGAGRPPLSLLLRWEQLSGEHFPEREALWLRPRTVTAIRSSVVSQGSQRQKWLQSSVVQGCARRRRDGGGRREQRGEDRLPRDSVPGSCVP